MNSNLAEVGKPTRWPPGQSGNPAGKPPGTRLGARQIGPGVVRRRDAHADGNTNGGVSDRAGIPEAETFQWGDWLIRAISSLECKNERDTHVSPRAGTTHTIGGNAAARRRYRSQRSMNNKAETTWRPSRALLLRSCRNRSERSAGGDGILPPQCVPVLVGGSRECAHLVEARKRQGYHGRRLGRPLHENEHQRPAILHECGGHLMTNHPPLGMVDVYAATIPSWHSPPPFTSTMPRRCCP